MSELHRRIVSRLRRYIANRRRTKRAQVQLAFTLSLSDPRATSNGGRRLPSIKGHTVDISTTGVALVVPAIRIGEHYLVGDQHKLHLSLELPDGPIELTVIPVRYESLEEDADDTGYIIGAKVVDMTNQERERFKGYAQRLLRKQGGN
jgi:hypothetical protein